MKLSMCASNVT